MAAAAVACASVRAPAQPRLASRHVRTLKAHTRPRGRLACRAAADDSPLPDALPVAGADSDWRKFRAQLVASAAAAAPSSSPASPALAADGAWAHSLPRPELGCLLLANPLMFQSSQQYFRMSVILLWAHDGRGSAGLILNRPTEYRVSRFGQSAGFLAPEFDSAQIYLGGDVGQDTVHLLHGLPGLPDAREITPGVWLGGFEAAKRGIAGGRFSVGQFKLLTRYAGWGPGQLEAECARGVWLPVSASQHAALEWDGIGAASPDEHWHHVAQLAGGDLAALSREVRGVADPDIARAAGGGYPPQPEEEEAEPGRGTHAARARWQRQQQRRGRLPEADHLDGGGI